MVDVRDQGARRGHQALHRPTAWNVEAITPRMLTVTLRSLERDGLVSWKVYPVVPPRNEYTLTRMGETLVEAVAPLIGWANEHLREDRRRAAMRTIQQAQRRSRSSNFAGVAIS